MDFLSLDSRLEIHKPEEEEEEEESYREIDAALGGAGQERGGERATCVL
jgi:hypothetical protein